MSRFLPNVPADFSETIIAVLAHSIWQSVVIALLVAAVLRSIPARRADIRYATAMGGLLSIVLMSFVTWSLLQLEFVPVNGGQSTSSPIHSEKKAGFDGNEQTSPARVGTSPGVEAALTSDSSALGNSGDRRTIATWLMFAWICIAAWLLVRNLTAVATVRSWATASARDVPLQLAPLEAIANEFCQQLKLLRKVALVVTDRVTIPAVIGTFSPIILIPAAMLSGIPADHWRIIIAHELAHVRRWDAIANLVQLVVESLLFFNPAVWWLSRQIRIEREACCDSVAAQLCGHPLSVARALIEVAAASVRREAPIIQHLSGSLAFAEPSRQGELTDRVQRLVKPELAPRSGISYFGLGALLLTLVLVAVVLKWSADWAVTSAATWMSPRERVDRLVRLQAEENGVFVPLNEGASITKSPETAAIPTESPEEAGGRIPVELIVRTDDGSTISRELQLHSLSRTGNNTHGSSLRTPREAVSEYRQTLYYPPCLLKISANQPGSSPAVSPMISIFPDDTAKTVELVLVRGNSVEFQILDEHQQPIAGAAMHASARVSIRGNSVSHSIGEQVSNSDGRVRMERFSPTEFEFEIQAAGFQRHRFSHNFANDLEQFTSRQPYLTTLVAALPTHLQVVDKITNQPVAHVRFVLGTRKNNGQSMPNGFSRKTNSPNHWSDFATSDERGVATFDQLESESTYTFFAVAEGYALSLVDVIPGESPKEPLKLSRPVAISGRIQGDLNRLSTIERDGVRVPVMTIFRRGIGDAYGDQFAPEPDHDGRFSIEDLSPGERLTFILPDERRELVIVDSVSNLEFDIPSKPETAQYPLREVTIRLTGTSPDAPARGELYVSAQHLTLRADKIQNGPLPVRSNEVRLEALVGARVHFSGRDLIGYRIDDRDNIEVTAGTGPQVITAEVTPTGGIHGSVTRHNGTLADRAYVYVFATKLPATEKDTRRINPNGSSGSSQFLRSVPLGGRYRVLAREESGSSCVWAISDEVTIDSSQPIARVEIKLPVGSDLRLRITDPHGQPVARQTVQLEIGFRAKPESGYSFRLEAKSTAEGFVTFEGVSLDQPLRSIVVTATAIVPAGPFLGSSHKVKPGQLNEIRLKAGVSATGVVIDLATGKPIPDAKIRLFPRDWGRASSKDAATTKSDAQGRFRFDGLDPIPYGGSIENASPKGTRVERLGGGGYRIHGSGELELTGGAANPVRWEVVIYPGSDLQPAE